MKAPLSWIKKFVDIKLPIEELAHLMTMAGLEVEEINYVGLPLPQGKTPGRSGGHDRPETKISGIEWDPEKIVVGAILEVMPHPNADRLVLCRLDDGQQEHVVLTGAPNLFPYKGAGPLHKPLMVAYAREGATLYDGHKAGHELMTLKRTKIRGVESYSMACSEKELGISEEHEGIIFLDHDAPVGIPLADYMGDVVFDIAITPNMARDANILGIAREIAALIGEPLREPSYEILEEGPSIEGMVTIEITEPALNPRFVLGLIRDVEIGPSPYQVQRLLRLSGVRPINNIVDATNFAMLEIGEPLHAFDYDVLLARARKTKGAEARPLIITRPAEAGERLVTLDDVERELDDFTVLVCDQSGALALAGVMGGAESEVSETSRNILLEGAAWNMINTRRTVISQNLPSEAAYRFSRGVHPAMAERGVRRGLEYMRQWSGGVVYQDLVDNYPLPPDDPTVQVTPEDVTRWLGIQLTLEEIADILERLDFSVKILEGSVRATTPDHRLDIGRGVTGVADLMEEIARIYGYDNIPETRLADELPPQIGNPAMEEEERLRDLLVRLGLQEVITYRMTSPEREARRLAPGTPPSDKPLVHIANPIVSDRNIMRQSLLASVLEVVERNARLRDRMAFFEIAPIYLGSEEGSLPDELLRLVIILSGRRDLQGWQSSDDTNMDFYDLKGVVGAMLDGLHLEDALYEPTQHPSFHPGKCARVILGKDQVGFFGELHPQVLGNYDLPASSAGTPILAAAFNLERLLSAIPERFDLQPVPPYPPVLEDLAVVVDEAIPAERVAEVIRKAGGKTVVDVRLFDVYQGQQIGRGQKSLAYSLTYQALDRTLTDKDVAKIRHRILQQLERDLGAKLRS